MILEHPFPGRGEAASPGPINTNGCPEAHGGGALLTRLGVYGSRTWRFAPIREWVAGAGEMPRCEGTAP
jgi:hypothetical protein